MEQNFPLTEFPISSDYFYRLKCLTSYYIPTFVSEKHNRRICLLWKIQFLLLLFDGLWGRTALKTQ